MDFTKITCISNTCKGKNRIMSGAGGCFGGRINTQKLKCLHCDLTLLIVPMEKQYQYSITATTEQERIDERIEAARKESELALAKTITRIKETGY